MSGYSIAAMNDILIKSQALIHNGDLGAVIEALSQIPAHPPAEDGTWRGEPTSTGMVTSKALENTRKQVSSSSDHMNVLLLRLIIRSKTLGATHLVPGVAWPSNAAKMPYMASTGFPNVGTS